MGTVQIFGGKRRMLPGSYADTKADVNNLPIDLDYGKIAIIDTGSGANYGAGSGINGTLVKNKEAIKYFASKKEMQSALRGGLHWLLAEYLFEPAGQTFKGVSGVYFIKAATTVPAEIEYDFGSADQSLSLSISQSSSVFTGGIVKIQVRNEGLVGNGVLLSGVLTRGYAAKMKAGPNADQTTPDKFVVDFYAGTFKGLDSDNNPYDFLAEADCQPELLASSVEFSNLSELVAWMQADVTFNLYFKLKSYQILGSGVILEDDLLDNATYKLASGGTEVYSSLNMDKVLENFVQNDCSAFLCDRWGSDAKSAYNVKIQSHINNEARFDKFAFVGGGADENTFESQSVDATGFYDDQRMVVVHAGIKRNVQSLGASKEYEAIVKAAQVAGRILGLPPQVPGTFKKLTMDGDMHEMSEKQKERATEKGVLYTTWDDEVGGYVIGQAINSIQRNTYLINNDDATSFEIAVVRISSQINREIIVNSKKDLLTNPNGANKYTVSKAVLEQWAKQYLERKVVTPESDNYLLSFGNVKASFIEDAAYLEYKYVPNTPINKIFSTGTMVYSL